MISSVLSCVLCVLCYLFFFLECEWMRSWRRPPKRDEDYEDGPDRLGRCKVPRQYAVGPGKVTVWAKTLILMMLGGRHNSATQWLKQSLGDAVFNRFIQAGTRSTWSWWILRIDHSKHAHTFWPTSCCCTFIHQFIHNLSVCEMVPWRQFWASNPPTKPKVNYRL